jgi:hypothetical protein
MFVRSNHLLFLVLYIIFVIIAKFAGKGEDGGLGEV